MYPIYTIYQTRGYIKIAINNPCIDTKSLHIISHGSLLVPVKSTGKKYICLVVEQYNLPRQQTYARHLNKTSIYVWLKNI
jgi:hypothetical protein